MLKVWPARPPSTPAGARVEGREMALLPPTGLVLVGDLAGASPERTKWSAKLRTSPARLQALASTR
jgi:hypothetical protein